MIGACGSVLIATMCFALAHPAMCWIAPLIPQARYSSGEILVPVCPTCCRCGRQPSLVTTLDTPRAPPSSPASSSSGPKPSAPPTPRPPPTTTLAVAREAPESRSAASVARTRRSAGASSGLKGCTVTEPGAAGTGSAATASGATPSRARRASRTASSSRLPDEPAPSISVPPGAAASGGDGKTGHRAEMRQDLVAVVGARSDHGARPDLVRQAGQGTGPGLRRVAVQFRRADRVHLADAVPGQLGQAGLLVAERHAQHLLAGIRGPGQPPGQGQRPQRRLRGAVAVPLDQAEHGHDSTPSSSSSATRAGTASVPWPRIRASRRPASGTCSRSARSPSGRQAGTRRPISARFARSRPGSEGYLGRLMPSFTVTTAGSEKAKISSFPRYSRRAVTAPPGVTERFLMPVTHGSPSTCATRTPTW